MFVFFFQAEDGIRDSSVTGVQTCALPILTFDLPLDAGAVTINFNFCRQCRHSNQVSVAHVVENRVRRCLSGQFRRIGNWEAFPYIRVRSDQGNDLLLSIRSTIDCKRHAHPVSLHYSSNTNTHLSHAAFQSRSKLKGLHSSRSNPDVGVAGIYKPGCCPQKADQEAPLKNHQEYTKRHAKHRYREADSIVNDVLPSEFHKS